MNVMKLGQSRVRQEFMELQVGNPSYFDKWEAGRLLRVGKFLL